MWEGLGGFAPYNIMKINDHKASSTVDYLLVL